MSKKPMLLLICIVLMDCLTKCDLVVNHILCFLEIEISFY
jgi:hypothetical protein